MRTGKALMDAFNEANNGDDKVAAILLHTTC